MPADSCKFPLAKLTETVCVIVSESSTSVAVKTDIPPSEDLTVKVATPLASVTALDTTIIASLMRLEDTEIVLPEMGFPAKSNSVTTTVEVEALSGFK